MGGILRITSSTDLTDLEGGLLESKRLDPSSGVKIEKYIGYKANLAIGKRPLITFLANKGVNSSYEISYSLYPGTLWGNINGKIILTFIRDYNNYPLKAELIELYKGSNLQSRPGRGFTVEFSLGEIRGDNSSVQEVDLIADSSYDGCVIQVSIEKIDYSYSNINMRWSDIDE